MKCFSVRSVLVSVCGAGDQGEEVLKNANRCAGGATVIGSLNSSEKSRTLVTLKKKCRPKFELELNILKF